MLSEQQKKRGHHGGGAGGGHRARHDSYDLRPGPRAQCHDGAPAGASAEALA